MKKYTLVHQSDREGFDNTCNALKDAKTIEDTFLQATRLTRQERPQRPFKETLMLTIVVCAVFLMVAVLVLGYFSGHFLWALAAVGGIAFIAILMGAAAA